VWAVAPSRLRGHTRAMQPVAESLRLPAAYGTPSELLGWADVEARLSAALHYWVTSVREDGRPHAVPVEGLWAAGRLVFGGDPATVHERNIRRSPAVSVHLADAEAVTILEGLAERHTPTALQAHDLAGAAREKYGYSPPTSSYRRGVWQVSPRVVLAWTALHRDATRFRFD